MNEFALWHIADVPYAYPKDETTLTIRLRTARNDLKSCKLFYKDRFDWEYPFKVKQMKIEASTSLFDYYSVDVSIDSNRYRYFFRLYDMDGNIFYLTERGVMRTEPKEPGAFQFPYIAKADVYHCVPWEQEGIVYQIFPDRFYNGNKDNDPQNCLPWGSPVSRDAMFGGDITGITQKIPYLVELGITFLYITPIFLSSSNHKYDTEDYYKIDPHFGTLEDVKTLVQKCHENNIRILFDAVFNHCGYNFFAFQDVLKNGANSRYKDWFFIDDFPVDTKKVNYVTFGIRAAGMPKLNTANPEVTDYLLSVTEYWMKEASIDGWRLDVSDEVDHIFWHEFRKKVKSINPQALIVGEVQHEASPFLRGDQMDSTMNYPFKEAAVSYFAKREITTVKFEDELTTATMNYMDTINRNMLNLIGSHDTERFLTMCDDKKERLKCAAVFQFTYIGVPYIYYGDEVGIDGGYDPLCRKCMVWDKDKQDGSLLSLYKRLCKIRKENSCLVYGDFSSFSSGNILAFSRSYKGQTVIVIINNSDKQGKIESYKLNGKFHSLLADEDVSLNGSMCLSANEYAILKPAE